MCMAQCNGSHAANIMSCAAAAAIASAACSAAYNSCLDQLFVQQLAQALADAEQWVHDNNPSPGTTIVIGGIVILVIACAIATEGLCLVVLA
jgi:hypothetical protein